MPRSFEWRLDWKSVLAIVLILPVLVGLGIWQLQRADEKDQLLAAFEARRQLPRVAVSELGEFDNYRPVSARGRFDQQRYLLLDNRIQQGQFGYEVIALLQLQDGRWLLVDRGWVQADPSRRELPALTLPEGVVALSGELYRSTEKPFSLGEPQLVDHWPRRQQWLDVGALQQEIEGLLPTVLQLNDQSPAALRIQRTVVNVSPEKHVGYAVQWFAMAVALAIIFVCRNTNIVELLRRSSTSDSTSND